MIFIKFARDILTTISEDPISSTLISLPSILPHLSVALGMSMGILGAVELI